MTDSVLIGLLAAALFTTIGMLGAALFQLRGDVDGLRSEVGKLRGDIAELRALVEAQLHDHGHAV